MCSIPECGWTLESEHPRLLVADQPTGNLDTATGASIIDLLLTIRETPQTSTGAR
jgi:predicted ABC-type transport system involved in lysophospholipase L1 biosynthesis ATPase subunit